MDKYDPSWLVELAKEQLPEREDFIKAWYGCAPELSDFNFDAPYKDIWSLERIPEKDYILGLLEQCREVYAYCECGCGDPYFLVDKDPVDERSLCIVLKNKGGGDIILYLLPVGSSNMYVEVGTLGKSGFGKKK